MCVCVCACVCVEVSLFIDDLTAFLIKADHYSHAQCFESMTADDRCCFSGWRLSKHYGASRATTISARESGGRAFEGTKDVGQKGSC